MIKKKKKHNNTCYDRINLIIRMIQGIMVSSVLQDCLLRTESQPFYLFFNNNIKEFVAFLIIRNVKM